MGPTSYGQIDLPERVRIQCEIGPGPREIGARYRLAARDDAADPGWWFRGD